MLNMNSKKLFRANSGIQILVLLFLRCIVILNDTTGTLSGWAKTEVAWRENKHEKLPPQRMEYLKIRKMPGQWNMFAGSSSHNNRGSAYSR